MKRCIILMTIDQAKHYSPEQCDEIAAAFLPHEREARAMGAPVMGSGRVFHIEEASIRVEPFLIPVHWPQINGIDFGWDHPFAAVNCAWDRDSDTVYVCREYRERLATPLIHAGALKPWGEWIPIAWPHDGLAHDKGSGVPLARQYAGYGLAMLPERATFEDGSSGLEAGLMEMLERTKPRLSQFSLPSSERCKASIGCISYRTPTLPAGLCPALVW